MSSEPPTAPPPWSLRIVGPNQAAAAMHGFSREEFIRLQRRLRVPTPTVSASFMKKVYQVHI